MTKDQVRQVVEAVIRLQTSTTGLTVDEAVDLIWMAVDDEPLPIKTLPELTETDDGEMELLFA